jgi:PHP domain-containing protein
MTPQRLVSIVVLSAGFVAGTVLDELALADRTGKNGNVMEVDLHVHAFPGDGSLPRWEIQREAARRGLDGVAITNHNQVFAGRFGWFVSGADVIVIPGEEITTPGFHMIAAGIHEAVDWRLPVRDAIAAIHQQGGVAIAAHPVASSWKPRDDGSLSGLDGVEVAHPVVYYADEASAELAALFARVRGLRPSVAPIGSSDSHALGEMGICRTYVIVEQRTERGVLDAIREGRTVASDGRGSLVGDPGLVELVEAHLAASPPTSQGRLTRLLATAVLLALASLMLFK